METSALYTVGTYLGLEVCAVHLVSDQVTERGWYVLFFKEEFKEIYHKTLKFECNFSELKDKILQFLPEAVYYVRRENEILLDFDPDRVHTKCQCKVKGRWNFCIHQFEALKYHVQKVYRILEDEYDPQIHFSGRGFHIIFFADKVIEAKNKMLELYKKHNLAFDPIIM